MTQIDPTPSPLKHAPVPPFLGSAVITEADIDIAEVFHYLDRNALFAGQWMLRKTKEQSRDDYEAMLQEKAEPVLQEWMQRCINESLLTPGRCTATSCGTRWPPSGF